MSNLPVVGQVVVIRSGMTGKVWHTARVLSVSNTGQRVTVERPTYSTGKAAFFRLGSSMTWRESYGGLHPCNDYFRLEG